MNLGEAKCETGRQPRHEQLKEMLNNLRSVTDHINDLNQQVGVKQRASSVIPAPAPPMAEPVKPADDLISVLDMLPAAVASEVDRIHKAISELQENLI